MPLDCSTIQTFMGPFLLAQDCQLSMDGRLRFATPFRYPDGEKVVLAVQGNDDDDLLLSDEGRTLAYIAARAVPLDETAKRVICQAFSLYCAGEALYLALTAQQALRGGLPDAVIDLGQACVRLASWQHPAPPPVANAWR